MAPLQAPPLLYGDQVVKDYLPPRVLEEGRLLPLEAPGTAEAIADVDGALRRALEVSDTPDLVPSLRQWLATRYKGGGVTIVVDDATRPCVHQRRLLPPLLQWLGTHGVQQDRIAIIVATATHRAPRDDEYTHILGRDVWSTWRSQVFAHDDQRDLARLGTMPDGAPVELNGRAARSQVILGLSDLDYHYFAGVTGGPKQLVPGIAGRALTTADHLRMFGPLGFAAGCDMGLLNGNPVYEYKREAVRIVLAAMRAQGALVYGVMAVLDPRQRFVALRGGDVIEVHRRVRSVLDRTFVARLRQRADIAIVSARHLGLNVYQAGKAINTAARAVRPGGRIACLAPCSDGFGNSEFRSLMALVAPLLDEAARFEGAEKRAAAIDRALRTVQDSVVRDFRIGKQKPVDLLLQVRHVGWGNLFLVCDGLSAEDRRLLPFRFVGRSHADPARRLRGWVEDQEHAGSPTYVVIDDPTYWIRVEA